MLILYNWDQGTVWRGVFTDYDTPSGNPGWYLDRFYLEWERGTQLAAAYCMQGDPVDVFYEYDANGLRTRKTVDNVNTLYLYIGSTLVRQVTGNETLCFSYGADGAPLGFTYNGTPYYYVTNLQGDVIAITDATGTIVVQYTYDAWGKQLMTSGTLASTIGKVNPLRYRGYYYDDELELYYLQSRYYDPAMCRFISPDSLLVAGDYLTGLNRYAYCNCNPVMFIDSNAHEATPAVWFDVPIYRQGSTGLCWAVCQLMVLDYYSGDNSFNIDEAKSLSEELCGYDDATGIPLNIVPIPISSSFISPELLLRIMSRRNGPLYAVYGGNGGHHCVVVTGIDIDNGFVYTNNPHGVKGKQSFFDFKNGILNSDGSTNNNYSLEYILIATDHENLFVRMAMSMILRFVYSD